MGEREAAWLVALILLLIAGTALFGGFNIGGRGGPLERCQLTIPGGFACTPSSRAHPRARIP